MAYKSSWGARLVIPFGAVSLSVTFAVTCATGFAITCAGAAHAALYADAVKKTIQDSDILPKEYKQQVYAACEKGVVTISLFRHPDATRDDCKIDSVLLTRQIMKLDPANVRLVRCVFYDYDRQNEFWRVEVNAPLVRAFGAGKIGQAELLNSLVLKADTQENPFDKRYAGLSYKSIIEGASVVPGPLEEKRLAVSLRMHNLQEQGVDMHSFHEDFLRIEDAARRGKVTGLADHVSDINKKIDERVQTLVSSGLLPQPGLKRASNLDSSKTGTGL